VIKEKSVFQGMSTEQGNQFAENCLLALRIAGFEIVKIRLKIPEVGIEADVHTMNVHGISMFWEFKGSLQGERPGSKRTDTLRKAIGGAYLFSQSGQYQCCSPQLLLTSHVPDHGAGYAMLQCLPRSIFFDVLNPWNHSKRLRWIANADESKLEADMNAHRLIDLIKRQWCINGG
jgi:hypothetical protein